MATVSISAAIPWGLLALSFGLAQAFQKLLTLFDELTHLRAFEYCRLSEDPVLQGILIAFRGAGSNGPAVHPAAPLSLNGGCATRRAFVNRNYL